MSEFFQQPPILGNQFDEDYSLQLTLRRLMGDETYRDVADDLRPFGNRVVGEIAKLGKEAESQVPRHVPYDPWGRRIDEIEVARAWQDLERISAEEGIVATAYERRHGEASRLHQLAKLYLFAPSSAVYSCPLAMTDGAARLIEVHGDADHRERMFRRLTSRDPATFWTSGQWMTERTGGSDVGPTSTIARRTSDGYVLSGTKWFTSATTSQMAMTLARIEAPDGSRVEGSRGLSLFSLETRRADGRLNGITIHRLKDKLGTKALPTAELTMDGTAAQIIGEPGEGVKRIVTLVNVTRIYNSVCAVAGMRRAVALARAYARQRSVFGRLLLEQPLHMETLANLQVELEAATALVFHLAHLMGRQEVGRSNDQEESVLRILTPVAKLYTGKQAVAVASEVLETFGGAGYVEDTGLPVLLRDAQVLPIWEGTTNVLSLDVLRSMAREGTFGPLVEYLRGMLGRGSCDALHEEADVIESAIGRLEEIAARFASESPATVEASARGFAFSIARVSMAVLLWDHARWCLADGQDGKSAEVVRRWCRQDLTPFHWADGPQQTASRAIAMDEEWLHADALGPAIAGRAS